MNRLRIAIAALLMAPALPTAAADTVRMAVTTTFDNAGLADHLVPRIEAGAGVSLEVIVTGTGQAHELARRGDVDLLMTHAPDEERGLVDDDVVLSRHAVMENDFVIVGPANDPANIYGAKTAAGALGAIATAAAPFISRGDRSGTHMMEARLWADANIDPAAILGGQYRPVGAGMGAALNMAAALGAYTLVDRGTWLAFGNRGRLALLFSGDPPIPNLYSVMIVNPNRHPHIAVEAAKRVVNWLVSDAGQTAIAAFTRNGNVVFQPVDDGRHARR